MWLSCCAFYENISRFLRRRSNILFSVRYILAFLSHFYPFSIRILTILFFTRVIFSGGCEPIIFMFRGRVGGGVGGGGGGGAREEKGEESLA